MNRKPETHRVTRLLREASDGEDGAVDKLVPLVYDQLQKIAGRRLADERKDHTLHATDLVHEAYLRMAGGMEGRNWENRKHFYRAAAEAMRRVLIDHAREKKRLKRGGKRRREILNIVDLASEQDSEGILALTDCIQRLEEWDARLGRVVRLRFYAGLSVEETAAALDVSARTVKRDWTFARAWLSQELEDAE